jgi:hypothetical protein
LLDQGGAFYRQTNGNIILVTKSGNHTDHESGNTYETYSVTKPEEARAYYITDKELARYKKIQLKSALAWWKLYCNTVPETTTKELHLIAGAVLPLWQRLKTTEDAQLKVVRVVTEDNQRIVGVMVPTNRVQQILRALGIASVITDPAEIIHAVLKNDDQIALVEGLSLSRSKIQGISYVELRGATHHKFAQLREFGLLNMKIEFRERFLLPGEPDLALEVLKKVLARYPIVVPETENPHEVPLPSTEFRALAQADTVNIFDLLIAPESSTPAMLESSIAPPPASTPTPDPPQESSFISLPHPNYSAQLTLWDAAA